ncbi:hypothetical protein KI372_00430 [Halobacterium salinarum]|uniref:hypothetical protein n=1 Tax=Halobacterium salinarum TaxID=2242 RepID=UPI001F21CDEB|nr:hypothetical protein [Halobacterium salinarum]MCF2206893.1 hypothetical protein [Halobacterium salinarum]MCF2239937.1 hypothetical protein [Halobacterium salinarum]
MIRRDFLAVSASGGIALIAGCTSNNLNSSPAMPEADTPPEELLPDPLDGWERTNTREIGGGFGPETGIETGQAGTYTPDGDVGYELGVYRFESESATTEIASEIEEQGELYNFIYAVQRGNFIIGGSHSGGTDQNLKSLLANSSVLTEQYLTENNLL